MKVVSNSTPLIALAQIKQVNLLHAVFGRLSLSFLICKIGVAWNFGSSPVVTVPFVSKRKIPQLA